MFARGACGGRGIGARFLGPAAALILGLVWLGSAALAADQPALPSKAPGRGKAQIFRPSVVLAPEIQAGVDSIRLWQEGAGKLTADRHQLYEAIHTVLHQYGRFANRMSTIYPPSQLNWILITDTVADSLTERVYPLLQAYAKSHPDEVLTDGRQKLEAALARIMGPPERLLGMHFISLSNYAYTKADSMLTSGLSKDDVGMEDGVLRTMGEWTNLYKQVHADPLSVFQCRTAQEDWIIARLEDKCGNRGSGVWQLVEEWMTAVGRDTTKVPPEDKFAHEYHLVSHKCADDTMIIYIDLPNYNEVQKQIARLKKEGKLGKDPLEPMKGH
jgi:hypothetical protein